jgi:hypothetical protein
MFMLCILSCAEACGNRAIAPFIDVAAPSPETLKAATAECVAILDGGAQFSQVSWCIELFSFDEKWGGS